MSGASAIADVVPERQMVMVAPGEDCLELERAFLTARREISADFREFDLTTKLRWNAARRIGSSWFDLVIDPLSGGVALGIVQPDFDPVARPKRHRATWRTLGVFRAEAELAGPQAPLT